MGGIFSVNVPVPSARTTPTLWVPATFTFTP